MKKKTSYADFLEQWKHLLNSLEGDAELANLTSKPKLEEALARVEALSVEQARHQANKQVATLDLQAAVRESKDLARIFIHEEPKGRLGDRTEKLLLFRVKPLRERRRSKSPAAKGAGRGKKPVDGTVSEPTVEPGSTPTPAKA